MVEKSRIPTLLRRNLSCTGISIGFGDSILLSAYRDQVERSIKKHYQEVGEVRTKSGKWELFTRTGFQIPWFDDQYPVTVKSNTLDGHFTEDFSDFNYVERPEGFAAVYFDQSDSVPIARTFVIGDGERPEFIDHHLRAFSSTVLENPLYTSQILDNLAKRPLGTVFPALGAGVVVGAGVGIITSLCLDYYFGLKNTWLYTVPLFGIPTAGLFAWLPSEDRESWLTRLRDSYVSRRLSEGVDGYKYGPQAEAEILTEDAVIREELKKTGLFGKWREMEIGDNKQTFLDFYKEFKKGGNESLLRARKVFADSDRGGSSDERFGRAVLVFSESIKEADDEASDIN